MSDVLPQGWASIALGVVLEFKYGKGLPQEIRNGKGSVNVYGSNGVVGVHDAAVTRGPTIIVGRKGSVGEVHLSSEGCYQPEHRRRLAESRAYQSWFPLVVVSTSIRGNTKTGQRLRPAGLELPARPRIAIRPASPRRATRNRTPC